LGKNSSGTLSLHSFITQPFCDVHQKFIYGRQEMVLRLLFYIDE